MIREDLRPCPFCGGKAYMWQTNYHTYIQCDNNTDGHLVQISASTEAEAVRRWESRWEQKRKYFRLVRRDISENIE